MISSAFNSSLAREQGNHSYLIEHQIPAYIRNTAMVFCVVIMCLGVVGNVMVPIVIMKTKDMRNSTNIFLMNLSLADLMVLLVCTPTVLVEVNTKPETWLLGKEMCLLVPFVELTVAHASVLTILAISFERYYAICEPLRAGYVCTKYRAVCICALAWIAAATFASPILAIANYHYMVYLDGSSVPVCLTQATTFWPTLYFLMIIAVFFIVPLLMLIILYSIIALSLVKTKSKVTLNQHADALSVKGRRQVVLMLATVVLSFFFCLTPFRMLTIWIIVSNEDSVDKIGLEPYYNLLYFSRIMIYLNSAINPILYNLMSSKFRNGFRKLCCTCQSTGFKFRTHRSSSSHVTASTSCQSGSSRDRRSHSLRIIYRKSSATNTIEKITDKNKEMNEMTRKLDIFLERAPTRRHSDIASQKEKVVPKFEKNREDLEENDEIEITLKVDVRKRISMDHKRLLRILNEEKANKNHV